MIGHLIIQLGSLKGIDRIRLPISSSSPHPGSAPHTHVGFLSIVVWNLEREAPCSTESTPCRTKPPQSRRHHHQQQKSEDFSEYDTQHRDSSTSSVRFINSTAAIFPLCVRNSVLKSPSSSSLNMKYKLCLNTLISVLILTKEELFGSRSLLVPSFEPSSVLYSPTVSFPVFSRNFPKMLERNLGWSVGVPLARTGAWLSVQFSMSYEYANEKDGKLAPTIQILVPCSYSLLLPSFLGNGRGSLKLMCFKMDCGSLVTNGMGQKCLEVVAEQSRVLRQAGNSIEVRNTE